MEIVRGVVIACFILIIALVCLSNIELAEARHYRLGTYGASVEPVSTYRTGWMPFDLTIASFYNIKESAAISSAFLVFIYFVNSVVISYLGSILGVFVIIVKGRENLDFIFRLAFATCVFFAILTTTISILI